MMATNRLSPVDYVVFALVLVVSGGIGIYYGIKQRKSSTTEFLLGGRSMSMLPVTLSLTASFMSAITLLGSPAEIYSFTTIFFTLGCGFIIGTPIAAHVYVPIFYNLKLTSIFEYVQLRFGTAARLSNLVVYMFQMVVYSGIVLYAPSLALEAVTGLNVWFSVLLVGIVCTLYTTVGGMKAVLWTDAFQMVIMIIGLLAVLIQGTIDFKGFNNIWRNMKESGRVEWWNFDPNPTVRHTTWGLVIGSTFLWLPVYAANQAQIQRALSLPSLKNAQRSYWISIPLLVGLNVIAGCCGMVCYSQYKDCDPISENRISSRDQILPLYVMDKLAYLPGIPGLFIASLFSGTLSTISSTLNSLSTVTLEDLIKPYCCPKISDSRASVLSKILALFFGAICISLTFVAANLGGILQASISLFGMIGGPQLGLFTLGILFPFANHIGALVGFYTGLVVILWIGMGGQIYRQEINKMLTPSSVSVLGCPLVNSTSLSDPESIATTIGGFTTFATSSPLPSAKSGYLAIYSLSYLWYGALSVFVVCFVGVVASLIADAFFTLEKTTDPRLTYPILSRVMPCLPQSIKSVLSCHVDYSVKPSTESTSKEHLDEDGDIRANQSKKSEAAYVNYAADGSMDSVQPQIYSVCKESSL